MSTAQATCEICTTNPSKYKCPQCVLRYCSLACYKTHKPTHPEPSSSSSTLGASSSAFRLPPRDRPGTTRRISKPTFEGFEDDPDFKRLFTRYPQLKAQLGAVYGMTLEPAVEDMRNWNRPPRGIAPVGGRFSHRGRGRGGGRGGGIRRVERRRWFDAEKDEDRQQGAWTKEKGNKEAMGILRRGRGGVGDGGVEGDERREGFREFVELCRLRFGERAEASGQEGEMG